MRQKDKLESIATLSKEEMVNIKGGLSTYRAVSPVILEKVNPFVNGQPVPVLMQDSKLNMNMADLIDKAGIIGTVI